MGKAAAHIAAYMLAAETAVPAYRIAAKRRQDSFPEAAESREELEEARVRKEERYLPHKRYAKGEYPREWGRQRSPSKPHQKARLAVMRHFLQK